MNSNQQNLKEVAEISGAINLAGTEILISDDSHLLYLYQEQKLTQNIKVPGGLKDPEAICIVNKDHNNGNLAIYGSGIITIIQLKLTAGRFSLNKNYSQKYELPLTEDKKIESLEYCPNKNIFVLIDRRKKDNYDLGCGIIYEYQPYTNNLITTEARIGDKNNKNDCKPTDMTRDNNCYHILTEEKIFTLNLNYEELYQQEIEKIKDAEAIYSNDNNYIIFSDHSKVGYKAKTIPKS